MRRFFTKIARFFFSWGFLKFILWTVTLIIFFYVEEDWRGARTWAATKAKWEAQGESFDFTKFIPPPVPDEQNLGALPVFKLVPSKRANGQVDLDTIPLRKALGNRTYDNDFPPINSWRRGELANLEEIREVISARYLGSLKETPATNDPIVQLDALYPFITDLRAEAGRPYCQFQYDGSAPFPAGRFLGLITSEVLVSKILTVRALLELQNHQSDAALDDLNLNFKLASGVRRDPATLIAALVAMGMTAITEGAIYHGLANHAWSDAQLAKIDATLSSINFLADYQHAFRGEVAPFPLDVDYLKQASPKEKNGYLDGGEQPPPLLSQYPFLWPGGWWDLNKARIVDTMLHSLVAVDPQKHRVFPDVANDQSRQLERSRSGLVAPWNCLAAVALSYLPEEPPKFAQAQVWVDEARIACVLERYRFAHGVYPETLDALAPAYVNALPHDVINGQPYHYRLRPEGTFLLYSVGWNQIDDGGKVVYEKEHPSQQIADQGDWVWPTPKLPAP
jgi:hypothetical protein